MLLSKLQSIQKTVVFWRRGEAWIWNFDEYDGRKLVDGAYHWSTPKLQKYTVTKDDTREALINSAPPS